MFAMVLHFLRCWNIACVLACLGPCSLARRVQIPARDKELPVDLPVSRANKQRLSEESHSQLESLALLLFPSVPTLGFNAVRAGIFDPRPSTARRVVANTLMQEDVEYDELDALDTVSDWDAELAEQEAWLAMQKEKENDEERRKKRTELAEQEKGNDEGDEPKTDVSQMFGSLHASSAEDILEQIKVAAAAKANPPSQDEVNEKIQFTLGTIVNQLARLEAKLDRVEKAQKKLMNSGGLLIGEDGAEETQKEKINPGEWDGVVDETVWFDEEDDDTHVSEFVDWRDVRKEMGLDD